MDGGGECVLGNAATDKYGVATRLRAGVFPGSYFNCCAIIILSLNQGQLKM